MEHTELPWRAVRGTGIRNNGGYIVFSKDKPFHYPGQDERYEREVKEWHGNLEYIAKCCNAYPAMEKAITDSITELCGKLCSGFCSCSECSRGKARAVLVAALAAGGE